MPTKNKKVVPARAALPPNSPSDGTRLAYTMREVAEAISASERTVYSLIQRGELRAVRLGRLVRIPHEAIAELLGGD